MLEYEVGSTKRQEGAGFQAADDCSPLSRPGRFAQRAWFHQLSLIVKSGGAMGLPSRRAWDCAMARR